MGRVVLHHVGKGPADRPTALPSLERHDYDAQVQPRELTLLPSQLRQVLPAGQSAEVPVEDHQKPVAPVLAKPMDGARSVL